jgi:acyl-CoA dehydrogenase
MNLAISPKGAALRDELLRFMDDEVYPAESIYEEQLEESGDPYFDPPIMETLKESARKRQLWNLFLTEESGVSNVDYTYLAEILGRSYIASEATNCAFPDSGNMEVLAQFGTPKQKERWLEPLLSGDIRSCFSMTEPEVAGSDPTTLQTRAELVDGEWVINGHKWFTSGAVGADFAIAMVVSDPDAAPYARASMIIVPVDTPGFNLVRPVSVMGHDKGPGHCEILYEDCRVPAGNLLGPRQAGFVIAQDRLGPGRIHHCMRAIGTCERAIELMARRANEREAFGGKLADKQFVQDFIAKSRIETEQARLLTLKAAWLMDTAGKREARREISMIKVVAANVVMDVLDRAIQVHGSLGMSDDTPLAAMWRYSRMLKVADGPDEVHKMVIARRELNKYA